MVSSACALSLLRVNIYFLNEFPAGHASPPLDANKIKALARGDCKVYGVSERIEPIIADDNGPHQGPGGSPCPVSASAGGTAGSRSKWQGYKTSGAGWRDNMMPRSSSRSLMMSRCCRRSIQGATALRSREHNSLRPPALTIGTQGASSGTGTP